MYAHYTDHAHTRVTTPTPPRPHYNYSLYMSLLSVGSKSFQVSNSISSWSVISVGSILTIVSDLCCCLPLLAWLSFCISIIIHAAVHNYINNLPCTFYYLIVYTFHLQYMSHSHTCTSHYSFASVIFLKIAVWLKPPYSIGFDVHVGNNYFVHVYCNISIIFDTVLHVHV